jgi:hypothetical protein
MTIGPLSWACASCDHPFGTDGTTLPDGKLAQCACCGNHELYRQKDFPQWLGMALLAVACGLFFIFAIRFQYVIAWTILLGSAALDGLIYLIVGDVVICYRCGAQHRGIPSRTFDPFDLGTAEKYRQERIRREKLQANKGD